MRKKIKAYVCSTNFDLDFPGTGILKEVYLDLEKLKGSRVCVDPQFEDYCGIYELEITIKKVIQKGTI